MPTYRKIEYGTYKIETIIETDSKLNAELDRGDIKSSREFEKRVVDVDSITEIQSNTKIGGCEPSSND